MHLNLKILKNDFKRNHAGNVSLLLFMTLAAGLVVVATIVVTQLITSIVGMYNTANPPHFLQMHKGEINQKAIDDFNSSYDGVTAWQTLPMIDVYGDDLKIYGDDIFNLSDCRRLKKMGFIFQQSHLLKTLSIRDNIVLPGFKAKSDSRKNVNAYAEKLMKRTGISQIADHDIKKVSGGQLQRAAICRALINHPNIIFADEPTGALDSGATKDIMDIINEVNTEGTTVMLVTHDAKVAARADRVIFLSDEIVVGKYEKKAFRKERIK